MGKIGRLSNDEIDNIRILLKEGKPIWKIAILTERSEYSIQNIKKEMMREEQQKEEPEEDPEEEQEETNENAISGDMKAWLKKNWHWKIPERQQKSNPPVKKRSGNFRTPYHYPGRAIH